VCYISEGDTRKTVESWLSYLTEVSEEAYRTLMAKYGDVFQQIQERLDSDLDDVEEDEERDRQEEKHYLFKIYQQLERQLKELPVVGFNFGKYDVNAMKVDFFFRIDEEPEDQEYREEKQQLHVHQDRGIEVPGHHQLHGSWF
jgi:hypothetical protein